MKTLKDKKIHFIGIGGISMSALAKYCILCGASVSGSDKMSSSQTEMLEDLGATIFIGENADMVDNVDIVVYSSAIKDDNSELMRAKKTNITIFERSEFLSKIADEFSKVIAIGGTHGKTTVTALITNILKVANCNFVSHIGGQTKDGNIVINGDIEDVSAIFLTEACEYKCNILKLNADIGVVLNAECDHPDCYNDRESVEQVFSEFLNKCTVKVLPTKCKHLLEYAYMHKCEYDNMKYKKDVEGVIICKDENIDTYTFDDIGVECSGNCRKMAVVKNGKVVATIKKYDALKSTPQNILFAYAVCDCLNVGIGKIVDGIESFGGVARRNEYVGKIKGKDVIFDYAHHPTQINNMLYGKSDALVVFQPHTYSRTMHYLNDFVYSLSQCKYLVLMPTYSARENECDGVDSWALFRQIITTNDKLNVFFAENEQSVTQQVYCHADDVSEILFLGAGDIYALKDKLIYD